MEKPAKKIKEEVVQKELFGQPLLPFRFFPDLPIILREKMMKVKMIIYLACISILGACSTSGEETLLQPVTQAGFQRVTFTRANNIPYSIAVFREFNLSLIHI